jgi:HD-like signal output (HDOD) protein
MKRILFVDENPRMLEELRGVWAAMPASWHMEHCVCGSTALALIERDRFDVVVTDLELGGLSGLEFLEQVKVRQPRVIRLILADRPDKEMVTRCVRSAHGYLSKPCDAGSLRIAIERIEERETALPNVVLRRLVGRMERLPSLPKAYLEIQSALRDPDWDVGELGRIVAQDIALTAQVLKLVNSASFGLRRNISDLKEAVSYLGVEMLQALVLSAQLFLEFEGAQECGFSLETLSRHSLKTAMACKAIARQVEAGQQCIEESFCAGMLHDTGKLILAHNFPVPYARILEVARQEACAVHNVERRILGATHADVGGVLLGLWGLSGRVVEAISLHHMPGREDRSGITPLLVLCVANALVNGTRSLEPATAATKPLIEALARKGLTHNWPEWLQTVEEAEPGWEVS